MTTEIVHLANSLDGPEVLAEVDALLSNLLVGEAKLESAYTKLGILLTEVDEKEYWRGAYESFGQYMKVLSQKFNRGRTQLYAYKGVAKDLLPHATEAQLIDMGVKKAETLRWAMKQTGAAPSEEIIEAAVQPSVSVADVRKLIHDKHNLTDTPREGMQWLDLGFYATKEEAGDITRMLENARRIDPPISGEVTDSKVIKQCLLRVAMDFSGTWEESVEKGEA